MLVVPLAPVAGRTVCVPVMLDQTPPSALTSTLLDTPSA